MNGFLLFAHEKALVCFILLLLYLWRNSSGEGTI